MINHDELKKIILTDRNITITQTKLVDNGVLLNGVMGENDPTTQSQRTRMTTILQ